MNPVEPRGPRSPLPDFSSWWSHTVQPWWRDIDYLGHVTAASYAAIYEEVFGTFIVEVWQNPEPSYVVSKMSISYLREIRLAHTPLNVHVHIDEYGASDISATMVITDKESVPRSLARNHYVSWDREQRRRRPMTANEAAGLRASTKSPKG